MTEYNHDGERSRESGFDDHPEGDASQHGSPVQQKRRIDIDFIEPQSPPFLDQVALFFNGLVSALRKSRAFIQLTWIDIQARTGSYVLSFCSVFVVVVMCVVLLSVLFSLPVVFLRLGEGKQGEVDFVLRPGGQMYSAASLDYSAIKYVLSNADSSLQLHVPRVEFSGQLVDERECIDVSSTSDYWYDPDFVNTSDKEKYICSSGCLNRWCHSLGGPWVTVIGLDLSAEAKIGWAADFPYTTPKKGEVIISEEAAFSLDIRKGDRVVLIASVDYTFLHLFHAINLTGSADGTIIMELRVIAIAPAFARKFGDDSTYALVNFDALVEMVAKSLSPLYSESQREAMSAVPTVHCATMVFFRLPDAQRMQVYVTQSFNEIRRRLVVYGDELMQLFGPNQIDLEAPILRFLSTVTFVTIAMDILMSMILAALGCLSMVLVYSLLTVGIETRRYDFGIQRMIGFSRMHLVMMVLTNIFFFTIPAWLLGLGAGQALYMGVRALMMKIVQVSLGPFISGTSVGVATAAGLLIPIVSAFIPIRDLLHQSLSEVLDSTRGRSGVIFKRRTDDVGQFNGTMLSMGAFLTLFGFIVYYIFPTSLVSMNLTVLFYIFFIVLLGMLSGLILLSMSIERLFSVIVSYVFLFWEQKAVFRTMQKSLASHRPRNRKTSLMYALFLGFIVFITVAFQMQLDLMQLDEKRGVGADISVSFFTPSAGSFDSFLRAGGRSLTTGGRVSEAQRSTFDFDYGTIRSSRVTVLEDIAGIQASLQDELDSGVVTSLTYKVAPLARQGWMSSNVTFSSPSRYRSSKSPLYAVPPFFFENMQKSFLEVKDHVSDSASFGLIQALYTTDGLHRLIVSTSVFNFLAMQRFSDVLLLVNNLHPCSITSNETTPIFRKATQASALLNTAPNVYMNKFPTNRGDTLTSLPGLVRLSGIDYMSCSSLAIDSMFVRVPRTENYKTIERKISLYFSARGIFPRIRNIEGNTADMQMVARILDLFLVLIQVMFLVVCFFSLMSSMTSNVLESSKEIAVMLCLGMSRFQVYRVYVWEAFVLLVTAALMGMLIGIVLAITMLLQLSVLNQLNVPFKFPYIQFCIVIGIGFVSAVVASCSPVAYLMNLPSITHILRRTLH